MRTLLILAMFLLPSSVLAEREVHVVSVAAGWEAPGDLWAVPVVPVVVDRPGASVALVVLDRGPVRWDITLSPGTGLDSIALAGDDPEQSEIWLHGIEMPHPDILSVDVVIDPRGSRFRRLVETITTRYDVPALAGFYGRYQSSEAGFVIEAQLQDDHLSADPLAQVIEPAQDWPVAPNRSSPELAGDRVLWDGQVFVASGSVPPPRFPMDVVHDPGRDVLYVMTLGGAGALYEVDVASGVWSVLFGLGGYDGARMMLDPSRNRLVMTGAFGRPGEIRLQSFDGTSEVIKIPVFAFPGLTDLYDFGRNDPVPLQPIAVDADRLWVEAVGRDVGAMRRYVIDLSTGDVRLLDYSNGG